MRTYLIGIFVLFGVILVSGAPQNPVTNQEIRDAILSLVHSNSMIDQKLERHEQRERALGELIKKGLMTLQKNQKIFEPIKGSFDRLDKRVSEIETNLLNNEKQTREEQKKLTNLLEKILAAFEQSATVSNRIAENSEEDDDSLPKKIGDLTDTVRELRREIGEMRADQDIMENSNKQLVTQTEEILKTRTNQAEVIAKKLEDKLNQLVEDGKNTEFENKITSTLGELKLGIKELRTAAPTGFTESDKTLLKELSNEMKDSIQDMRLEVLTASDKSFAKTATRIKETHEAIDEVSKSLTDLSIATEAFYAESQKTTPDSSQPAAGNENIAKLEKIMIDTSNNVLETKRRFEYGIHQIILEVGDVMKTANTSMQKRLNELNDGILENHNNALVNLSSKIETEMSQVWRQVGIMYQEITSSKKVLDHLQEQTELYVNGTITTMDSMEGKVGLITNRMQEVDSNLNYLLGRLSLVTQEFNQIKFGLGEALDNIRSSFMTVQDKVKQNVGPGPHQIPEDHTIEKRSFPFNFRQKRNNN
ncbi:putative leucine-rich repeat-containing protein DDB_G0290503 [Chironomus tepperi]|uniref:putative leucine-rich repeat-containing protein DDB_G0290503 n=1 Tax=Chironomus tepperi TaxID=113505 RepID=UPI00391FB698